jgi:multiple sugar transport system substrate-binding protein
MRRVSAWLSFSLCVAGLVTAIADAAQAERLIFLSTQLRPIEEAQKMRNVILKGFPREVDYITEQPQQFPVRIAAEEQSRAHTIDVVGALHGELQPLVPLDALVPLDVLAGKLTGRGIPDSLLALGTFGTAHQLYIPWMQASYIMVANKERYPICLVGLTSTRSATTSSLLGPARSSRRPASACSAFRRDRKG